MNLREHLPKVGFFGHSHADENLGRYRCIDECIEIFYGYGFLLQSTAAAWGIRELQASSVTLAPDGFHKGQAVLWDYFSCCLAQGAW